MNWESIQQFFRDNPRAWLVGGAAVLALGLSVWGIWGGFSLQFSKFFAAAAPPAFNINNSGAIKHGEKLSVSWSATGAQRCDAQGWFDTGGANEGTATSDPIDACSSSAKATGNQVGINCTYANGDKGVRVLTFSVDKSTCPSSGVPTPTEGGPTPTGGGAGFPVDPSGKCVFRTNFNAPTGAWFCESLQCALAGNPPFEPTSARKAPEGPAVRLAVNVMGQGVEPVDPTAGPINIRTKLDSTPKCGNGKECYPPKDPLWSCTQENGKEVDLGRNGHDYYDCYNPIIHRRENGKITCCANTGLAGDCFTWDYQGGPLPSGSVAPSSSVSPTTPTPLPVNPLLKCAPIEQTVALKAVATVTASGGNGKYTWELSGSGVQQGGTANSVQVSYTVSGQKVVRASSGGQIATCVVTVSGTGGGGTISPIAVTKRGSNASTGSGGESSAITINPNEYAQFRVSITNNGTTDISGLTVRDTLPTGMTYRAGSTTIDGQVVSVDTITAGGLVLDNLPAGGNVNINWSAVADGTAQLAAGPHQSQPKVVVSGPDIADATADMSVTVYSSGATGTEGNGGTGAGGVPTGPGDAVTIALVMAAALTLLYSGYTRSSVYRRHDADVVSRDQGPMDFRS